MSQEPDAAAGSEYQTAAQTIRKGFAIQVMAFHICWMLGDNQWRRPVWRERAVPPDGKHFDTPSFDEYLLRPAREGLHMPSLLAVHKLCEADPKHGAKAIALMRREIAGYDAMIEADEKAVLDAAPKLAEQGGDRRSTEFQGANSTLKRGSTQSAYLAARLKRDAPDEWRAYMDGAHKSVRAAALAAGIAKPPDQLKQLQKLWPKLTEEQRAAFDAWRKEQP